MRVQGFVVGMVPRIFGRNFGEEFWGGIVCHPDVILEKNHNYFMGPLTYKGVTHQDDAHGFGSDEHPSWRSCFPNTTISSFISDAPIHTRASLAWIPLYDTSA